MGNLAPAVGLAFVEATLSVASDLQLDPEEYLPGLEGLELTRDQKLELLQALWSIMKRFVDMAYDGNNCGQLAAMFNAAATGESGVGTIPPAENTTRTLTLEASGRAVAP